ncbi:MAG: VIT1/CCC1 transporter family protein [Elusimicrobia bacterium]|nr:VIT1/CCC1 transporter family protein [Elusimicrobiota bacterium]
MLGTWTDKDIKAVEENFLEESSSRWMYLALATMDHRLERAELLRRLADYEDRHATLWVHLLQSLHRPVPPATELVEHKILVALARLFGVAAVLPVVHKSEVAGIAKYRQQAARWTAPQAQAAFEEILPDEVAHEVDIFQSIRQLGAMGGALRSMILGANDGLSSVLALTAGVAGATHSSSTVLISGVAGLTAGAISMAASNYVSVKAEQEIYTSQRQLQEEALTVAPGTKRTQLKEAYRRKQLTEEEAEHLVVRLSSNRNELLKALLAEVDGITEMSLESPGRLGAYTGVAFALGGFVPIVPFLFLPVLQGIVVSVAFTGVALFCAGVVRALASLNPFLRSGIEMVLIGMGSATVTYLVGLALGSAVG